MKVRNRTIDDNFAQLGPVSTLIDFVLYDSVLRERTSDEAIAASLVSVSWSGVQELVIFVVLNNWRPWRG